MNGERKKISLQSLLFSKAYCFAILSPRDVILVLEFSPKSLLFRNVFYGTLWFLMEKPSNPPGFSKNMKFEIFIKKSQEGLGRLQPASPYSANPGQHFIRCNLWSTKKSVTLNFHIYELSSEVENKRSQHVTALSSRITISRGRNTGCALSKMFWTVPIGPTVDFLWLFF